MNAALESILECPLSSSAGVNLRLNDKIDTSQLARDLLYFIECRGDFASRGRHIEFLEQLLGLILVNVHSQNARAEVQLAWGTHVSNGFSLTN